MRIPRIAATTAALTLIVLAGAAPAGAATDQEELAGNLAFLREEELAGNLAFLREEERLARDLYAAFAQKYPDARVFANIAQSEQRHMDAVLRQLDLRDLPDPGATLPAGDYAFAALDKLYADWFAQGATLAGALQVGIDLETWDIKDIERIRALPSSAPVERTLTALREGSENHLAAFTAVSAKNRSTPGMERRSPRELSARAVRRSGLRTTAPGARGGREAPHGESAVGTGTAVEVLWSRWSSLPAAGRRRCGSGGVPGAHAASSSRFPATTPSFSPGPGGERRRIR